jgi:hypothetical protein
MRKLLIACMLFFACNVWADSPLTSTNIHLGYKDNKYVQKAMKEGVLSDDLKDFIILAKQPLGLKIAVISALEWETMDPDEFFVYLQEKKKYRDFDDFLQRGSGEMLVVVSYMKARKYGILSYELLDKAMEIAKIGKTKIPKSYTANMVYAIMEAQRDDKYCKAHEVDKDPTLIKDMSEKAVKNILEYIYCN